MKKRILQTLIQYTKDKPRMFHMPAHSGRYIDKEFEQAIQTHGMKMLDVAWLYLPNCEGLEFHGKRLGDLGSDFHSAFSSQLTLFL